eukprot:3047490-Amphidinium_carterae.2
MPERRLKALTASEQRFVQPASSLQPEHVPGGRVQRTHITGSYQADEPHQIWGTVGNALSRAGLRGFSLCLQTLLNLASGPYGSAAFFQIQKIRDGSR